MSIVICLLLSLMMIKDGVALGEYQTALLQKIEELTLYILEQQNQINDLQKQINQSTMKP